MLFFQSYCGNIESVNIRSQEQAPLADNSLPTPFRFFYNENIESLAYFFDKYISKREEISTDLIGFWHKIYRAWQAGLENVALLLTVSVEGMVKTHLLNYGLPDTETLDHIKEAVGKVNTIDLDRKLKERLLSSLGHMKSPTVKGALFGMAQLAFFPKEWVTVWSELRNRSAHADRIDLDKIKLQKLIDQIYCCFTLYYRILYLIIEYEGKYTNYSQPGRPENDFVIPEMMK